ncbi:hypothetical protein Trydic_g1226 [Trypoxylus dichotomus]
MSCFLIVLMVFIMATVNGYQQQKPGLCPKIDLITTCEVRPPECDNDWDCPGVRKCCTWGCGRRSCLIPNDFQKPGSCPKLPPHTVGICALLCHEDGNCPGKEKCCSTGCGLTCKAPVEDAIE